MEAEKKKLQTWLVTCLVTWVVTKTWKILSLSMFGDIIQTLLEKLAARLSHAASFLSDTVDRFLAWEWNKISAQAMLQGSNIHLLIAFLIVVLLLFQNDPSTRKACFFWHNEEKKAIAAHTCSYYNHHCNPLGNTYMRLILVLCNGISQAKKLATVASSPLSSPLLSLASPFLHQLLQSSPQNRQWLVCLTETRGVIIQCIKALS